MAESFSDIMSNYKNMSIEELGGSLLQRQSDQAAAAAKRAKKQDRVQQALALMLTGQAIFKGAYNKRSKELDDRMAFDAINNAAQAKQMSGLSNVISVIPDNFHTDKSTEERANLFLTEKGGFYKAQLENKWSPYIDSQIKISYPNLEEFKTSNPAEYSTLKKEALQQLSIDLFSKDDTGVEKYKRFENELRDIFKNEDGYADMDRLELLRAGLGLDEHRLTRLESQNYEILRRELRNRSNIIGGVKDMFQHIGNRAESKGGINLFKNLTVDKLQPSRLDTVLDELDFKGMVVPIVDKALARIRVSPTRYKNAVDSLPQETRDRVTQAYTTMKSKIVDKELAKIDSRGLLSTNYGTFTRSDDTILSEYKWDHLTNVFDANEPLRNEMLKGATALSLRFNDDPNFAMDLYKEVEDDSEKINQFKVAIQDEEFRNQFSIAMVMKAGFTDDEFGFDGGYRYIEPNIDEKNIYQEGYNPEKSRESLDLVLGEGIDVSRKGFIATKEYNNFSKKGKIKNYDMIVEQILTTDVSETERQKTLDLLFDSIPNPRGLNQQEYIMTMESEIRQSKQAGKEILFKSRNVGRDVTMAAINAVTGLSENESPEYVKNLRLFMRDIARVESDFGENENTFSNPNSSATGIFQVKADKAMAEVQRRIKEPNSFQNLKTYNKQLKESLGIDLSTATAEDLETPIYSAAFARGYLMTVTKPIPTDPQAQANYWRNNYNKGDDYSVSDYLIKNRYFIDTMQEKLGNLFGED